MMANSDLTKNSDRLTKQIQEELSQMTFEELLKLKDELGTKVYADTILSQQSCNNESIAETNRNKNNRVNTNIKKIMKRLNHNQPREESSKKTVPFMSFDKQKTKSQTLKMRDPRFDERSGEYNAKIFKTNYKFLTEVREKEIKQLKDHLKKSNDPEMQTQLKKAIQKLNNKNVEERKWHQKQLMITQEKTAVQQAKQEGKKTSYLSKGELKAKMLVKQYEELKSAGRLQMHLQKRRRKRVTKDRKKLSFD